MEVVGPIVFVSERDGNEEIYVMAEDGSDPTRLTNNSGRDVSPRWLPDGSRVVFQSDQDGNFEVYVMDGDGSNQVNVTQHVADDQSPSWSPDGTRIAFSSNREGDYDIFVIDADGSEVLNCTGEHSPEGDFQPRWSPDGETIAFSKDATEIWTIESDCEAAPILVVNIASGGPSDWSPDGSQLLYTSNPGGNSDEVYVIDADGSDQECKTCDDTRNGGPSWSPEGGRLVLNSRRDGTVTDPAAGEVYVRSLDGSEVSRLTMNSVADGGSHWQPFRHVGTAEVGSSVSRAMTVRNGGDGDLTVSEIALSDGQFTVDQTSFTLVPGGSQQVSVTYTPTVDGTSYSTLTISSDDPDLPSAVMTINGIGAGTAPDMQIVDQIVYQRNTGGNEEIFRMEFDGTGVTNLTNGRGSRQSPTVVP